MMFAWPKCVSEVKKIIHAGTSSSPERGGHARRGRSSGRRTCSGTPSRAAGAPRDRCSTQGRTSCAALRCILLLLFPLFELLQHALAIRLVEEEVEVGRVRTGVMAILLRVVMRTAAILSIDLR